MAKKKSNRAARAAAHQQKLGESNISSPWGKEPIQSTPAVLVLAARDQYGLRLAFQRVKDGEVGGPWGSDYFRDGRERVAFAEIVEPDMDALSDEAFDIFTGGQGSVRFDPNDAPTVNVSYKPGQRRPDAETRKAQGLSETYGCSIAVLRTSKA